MVNIIVIDKQYSWNDLSLYNFLYDENNYPKKWEEFFTMDIVKNELKIISEKLWAIKEVEIYPPINEVFKLFYLIDPRDIKIFTCAQDPYHNPGSAVGVAFSVRKGNALNPSLNNIYKKVEDEIYNKQGKSKYFKDKEHKIKTKLANGDLKHWVKQGIFLYNTSLTVTGGEPGSHKNIWQNFSDILLKYLCTLFSKEDIPVIWILLGAYAQDFALDYVEKGEYIIPEYKLSRTNKRGKKNITDKSITLPCRNYLICCSHPSPYSYDKNCRGYLSFKYCPVFKEVNSLLKNWNREEIIF